MPDPIYHRFEPIEGSRLRLGWVSYGKSSRTERPVLVEDATKRPYENHGYANRRVGQVVTVSVRPYPYPDGYMWHVPINVPKDVNPYEGAARFMRAMAREYWPCVG